MGVIYKQSPKENAVHTYPVSSKQGWPCFRILGYKCGHSPRWDSAGNLQEPMNYFLIGYWAREMRFFSGTKQQRIQPGEAEIDGSAPSSRGNAKPTLTAVA